MLYSAMRQLCTILLLVLSYGNLSSKPVVGIELGLGQSILKVKPTASYKVNAWSESKSIFSWKVAGFADVMVIDNYYFQAGLCIARKGGEVTVIKTGRLYDSSHYKAKISYVEIPLNIVYKTGEEGRGRFIIGAGGTLSCMIGGKQEGSGSAYSGILVRERQYHTIDLGVNVLAGCELPFGLFVKGYLTIGTKDISFGDQSIKNGAAGISVGYFLKNL